MNTLAVLVPIITIGNSLIFSWLISLAIIAGFIWFVIWIVSKLLGPPSIPEPFRWILWIIIAAILLIFLFSALGIAIP